MAKQKKKESFGEEEWAGCFLAKISRVRWIPTRQRQWKVSAKLSSNISRLSLEKRVVSFNLGQEMWEQRNLVHLARKSEKLKQLLWKHPNVVIVIVLIAKVTYFLILTLIFFPNRGLESGSYSCGQFKFGGWRRSRLWSSRYMTLD